MNTELKVEITINENPKIDYDFKHFTETEGFWKPEKGVQTRKTIYQSVENVFYNDMLASEHSSILFSDEKCKKNIRSEDKTRNGVWGHLSLNQLCDIVNQYSKQHAASHSSLSHVYFEENKKLDWNLYPKDSPEYEKIEEAVEDLKNKVKTKYVLQLNKNILNGIKGKEDKALENNSPFLFYDIDVKEDENEHLYEDYGKLNKANIETFEKLKAISLLTFRSSRRLGICGVLYVPALSLLNKNVQHYQVANEVLSYINKEYLDDKVEFDKAQSYFSTHRRIPAQYVIDGFKKPEMVSINKNALGFEVDLSSVKVKPNRKREITKSNNGLKKQTSYISGEKYLESFCKEKKLIDLFNKETLCKDLLGESGIYEMVDEVENKDGFTGWGKGNGKKPIGVHSDNYFHSFKESVRGSTPFHLLVQFNFKDENTTDLQAAEAAYQWLIEKYKPKRIKDIESNNKDVNSKEKNLRENDKFFFDPVEFREMSTLTVDKLNSPHEIYKVLSIDSNGQLIVSEQSSMDMMGYMERDIETAIHMHYTDEKSGFVYESESFDIDRTITINLKHNEYLNAQAVEALCAKNKITYIHSGCGTGKTTIWLRELVATHKVLFLMPRVGMVKQQLANCNNEAKMFASFGENENLKIDFKDLPENIRFVKSVGKNPDTIFDENGEVTSGFMTYNQFVEMPVESHLSKYDYVVYDETHLLTIEGEFEAMSGAVTKLEELYKTKTDVRVVLMSATPETELKVFSDRFEDLKMIEVIKKHLETPNVYIVNVGLATKSERNVLMFERIIDCVTKGQKVMIYVNNGNKIANHWSRLKNYCLEMGYNIPSKAKLSTDNMDTEAMQSILESERLTNDISYCTSLMNVGLNINTEDKENDKGVAFIFDAIDSLHSFDLSSQVEQLLFRNRTRKSDVYVFGSFNEILEKEKVISKDKNGEWTEETVRPLGKKYDTDDWTNYIDIKTSSQDIEKRYARDLVKLKSYQIEEQGGVSILSASLKEHHKLVSKYKRSLYTFIRYAYKRGLKLNYDNISTKLKSAKSDVDVNKFAIHLLKLLVENDDLNLDKITINKVNGNITNDVSLENGCFTFHEIFNITFRSIVRKYDALLKNYGSNYDMVMLIGYIIDKGNSRASIESRLAKYIKSLNYSTEYPLLLKSVSKVVENKERAYDIEKELDLSISDLLNVIKNDLKEKVRSNTYSKSIDAELIKSIPFNTELYANLRSKVEEVYKLFYSKEVTERENETIEVFHKRPILRCPNLHEDTNSKDNLEETLLALRSKDMFAQEDSFDDLLKRLDNNIDDSFADGLIIDGYDKRTTFNKLFDGDKEVDYTEAIDELKRRYKRIKKGSQPYVCIDNTSNVVIAIETTKKKLHELMIERDSIKHLESSNNITFSDPKIFKNSSKYCTSHSIKKITI